MGDLHEALEHVFAGRLKPVVDCVFPMRELRAARIFGEERDVWEDCGEPVGWLWLIETQD